MNFKLCENDNLENYIYYNRSINDSDSNLINGLKFIHKIYYNKYNTYKILDKLRYFVLFDEKGDITNIIDSFKNCYYYCDLENKKLIKIDKFLINFNLFKTENGEKEKFKFCNIHHPTEIL
jgi:hypothetical protein